MGSRSKLFAVLSAETARVASEEARARQPSPGLAGQNRGGMETGPNSSRKERHVGTKAHAVAATLASQHLLFGESFFFEQKRVSAAAVPRYTDTLNEFLAFARMSMSELKLPELDGMVVEMLFRATHGAGHYLMAGWIRNFADLPRTVRALKGDYFLALGMSRGRLPWVSAAPNKSERQRWRETRSSL